MRERTNRTVRAAAVALILFLLTGAAASAAAEQSILDFIGEIADSPLPAGAAELVRPIMHRETVNDVEITILDAAYDGRTLFLRYNFRMTDVDAPLGVTAEELFGDELPEDIAPGTYVYGMTDGAEDLLYAHRAGWWADEIWIDGEPLGDMPDSSGQYLTGTGTPGELIEEDAWRLDNLGVFLEGEVRISLPIGEHQSPDVLARDEEGRARLPENGVVTFTFDAEDALSRVRVLHPEGETVLPEVTVSVREAAFTPLMTYITLDLTVNPDAMAAFIDENGECFVDEDGEELWEYGPMDVFGAWTESLTLTDGEGNVLFPECIGPDAYSDLDASFLCPCVETMPDALYLAPVDDEGVADMEHAVRIV